MLVRDVVVDDQVHVEVGGHVRVDPAQEAEELLMSVARLAVRDHRSGSHFEGGEQGGGAVAPVIVGHPLDVAQPHRQHRLRPLQSLDLALFVDAQHHRVVRGVEVEPDDVAYLLDEERVGRQLEVLVPVRLQAEQLEPALHGALRDPAVRGHRAHAPVRPRGRLGLQGVVDDGGHPLVVIGSRPAGAEFIVQPFQAALPIPSAPPADGGGAHAQACGDGCVRRADGACEHDLRSLDQAARERPRPTDPGQFGLRLLAEFDGRDRTTSWHRGTSCEMHPLCL